MIKIKEPIWKDRAVGIATWKAKKGEVKVQIEYENNQGEKVFPGTYKLPAKKVQQYDTKEIKDGVKLYIVPIEDFDVIEQG